MARLVDPDVVEECFRDFVVVSAFSSFFADARLTLARAAPVAKVAMRAEALSLFRQLHRAAGLMPTSNRAAFVRAKVRIEYEAHRGETECARVVFLLRVGETQLENIKSQAAHLTDLFADPRLHSRV